MTGRVFDPSAIARLVQGGDLHGALAAARECEPADLAEVLQALEDDERLRLVEATRVVLANGLGLLAVTAPERM